MLREYKHRHAIVRWKKWDKIILCEICVGPTGHISDKTVSGQLGPKPTRPNTNLAQN